MVKFFDIISILVDLATLVAGIGTAMLLNEKIASSTGLTTERCLYATDFSVHDVVLENGIGMRTTLEVPAIHTPVGVHSFNVNEDCRDVTSGTSAFVDPLCMNRFVFLLHLYTNL